MGAGWRGSVAGLLGALLLAAPPNSAFAQVREESAAEFNARAGAQEEAYMRQWEAEQATLRAQVDAPPVDAASADRSSVYPSEHGIETPTPAAEAGQPTLGSDAEAAGLRCLNESRATAELPPISLQEFREGRAAGMIATPETLCGRDYVGGDVQQTDPEPAAALESPTEQAVADQHFARAGAWGRLQDQITFVGLLGLAALLYFIPAIIAFRRQHHYRWPIFAFNLGAAWTGLGWIGTLVWALWPQQSAIIDPVISDATGIDRR